MRYLLTTLTAIAVGLAVVAAAGIAGNSAKGATPAHASATSTIGVRRTSVGRALVDANGRTLYLFEADGANMRACSGSCLSVWPALTAHVKPGARGGAVASKIGTIAGPGSRRQVTYAKHPLYYYAGDRKPGDTNGQGLRQFGAKWYVLSPAGRKIDND